MLRCGVATLETRKVFVAPLSWPGRMGAHSQERRGADGARRACDGRRLRAPGNSARGSAPPARARPRRHQLRPAPEASDAGSGSVCAGGGERGAHLARAVGVTAETRKRRPLVDEQRAPAPRGLGALCPPPPPPPPPPRARRLPRAGLRSAARRTPTVGAAAPRAAAPTASSETCSCAARATSVRLVRGEGRGVSD